MSSSWTSNVSAVNIALCSIRVDASQLAARFASTYSTLGLGGAALQYFNIIVKFLSVDYLDILLLYSYNIIYRLIVEKERTIAARDTGYWRRLDIFGQVSSRRRQGQALIWLERIREITLSGADQVLALTEESINRIFFARWKSLGSSHILTNWSRDTFRATFNHINVRLLSSGRVIIFVDMVRGELGART